MDHCAVLQPQVEQLTCENTSTHWHSQAPDKPRRAPFATQSATHFDLAAKPSYEVANIKFDDRTVCVHDLSPRFTSANRLWSVRRAVQGWEGNATRTVLDRVYADRIAAVLRPTQKCFELERRLGGSRLAVYSPRADGADGQGGHDQHGVPGDGGVEPDLGFIKPEAVLAQPEFFFHAGASRRTGPRPQGSSPATGPGRRAPWCRSRYPGRRRDPCPRVLARGPDAENVEVE
jgi:hypothetical protein